MFIPKPYRVDDRQKLIGFMKDYPFATIITDGGKLLATHLPFLVEAKQDEIKLISHLARANPQWKQMQEQTEVLVIFQGPHAYISAAFYPTPLGVPTWNYAAVHAYGKPVLFQGADSPEVIQTLQKTIATYEPGYQTQFENMPAAFANRLRDELVAFEIRVTSLEGAFKLSQDKTIEVQQDIAQTLSGHDDSVIAQVGRLMKQNLSADKKGGTA